MISSYDLIAANPVAKGIPMSDVYLCWNIMVNVLFVKDKL